MMIRIVRARSGPTLGSFTSRRHVHHSTNLTLVPLYTKPRLIQPCIDILNDQYPNGKSSRLEILEKTFAGLPYSIALVGDLDKPTETVYGHRRLVEARNVEKGVYFEAGVIDRQYRGQGLGRTFMTMNEDMCRNHGFKWSVLGTTPQLSKMFLKFGYKYCDWRVETIGSGMLATTAPLVMDQPCPGWEHFYREPVANHNKLASASLDHPTVNKHKDGNVGNTLKLQTGTNPDNIERSEDASGELPPTWSFDYFDRNEQYCWLKKTL